MDFFKRVFHATWLVAMTLYATSKGGAIFLTVLHSIILICVGEWETMCETRLKNYCFLGYLVLFAFYTSMIILQQMGKLWPLYAIVWTTDSFAYIFGNIIGGPKIFQSISPNKTFSGTIGGIFSGIMVSNLFQMHWTSGLVIAVAAQFGDFLESAAKRIANVKDSNVGYVTIPGHGGVLDRMDALIFAAPVALMMAYNNK